MFLQIKRTSCFKIIQTIVIMSSQTFFDKMLNYVYFYVRFTIHGQLKKLEMLHLYIDITISSYFSHFLHMNIFAEILTENCLEYK